MTLEGHVVDVRASIGIAAYPDHGDERSTLLRHADVAMYAAKRNNLGIAVWDDRYDQHSKERLSLMSELRKAVDNDELVLVYQPKVALARRRRASRRGAGALAASDARPRPAGRVHPVRRADRLHPRDHALGDGARDRAMRGVARRRPADERLDQHLGARPDRSRAAGPLRSAAAQARLRARSGSRSRSPKARSSTIPDHAIDNLQRLHALGCRLAIDDYGTGYSSLAYLRRLPVHELKIDKTFVLGMARDASDAVIVRSTIDLAHNMGLMVVAEGVEDEATLERLRALGCDMVQGYLLSRPLAAAELVAWMRGSVWTRAARDPGLLRRVV